MAITLDLKSEIKAEAPRETATGGAALQEHINKMIAEAVKRQPPPLSREEQRKKNQAVIDLLHEWDEEDKTDDPEEIARRQAEWEEFKAGMNAAHTSNRIIYP